MCSFLADGPQKYPPCLDNPENIIIYISIFLNGVEVQLEDRPLFS